MRFFELSIRLEVQVLQERKLWEDSQGLMTRENEGAAHLQNKDMQGGKWTVVLSRYSHIKVVRKVRFSENKTCSPLGTLISMEVADHTSKLSSARGQGG